MKKTKVYLSGKACKRGHTGPRYMSTKQCIQCVIERQRDLFKNDPVWRARHVSWFKRNPLYHHRYYERRKAYFRFKTRLWYMNEETKPYRKVYASRRRAAKRDSRGQHTHEDIRCLLAKQHRRCNGCSCSLRKGYHVDHKHPLVLGGSNGPRNLQLLCPSCNSAKGAKTMRQWNRYLELRRA